MTDMRPRYFRKKPVEVEAVRFVTNNEADCANMNRIVNWLNLGRDTVAAWHNGTSIFVESPWGATRAEVGDWIIRERDGGISFCAPDVFDTTYEEVPLTDTAYGEPHPVVQWFAQEMERKLRENVRQGEWREENSLYLAKRFNDECLRLANALFMFHTGGARSDDVISECADVANYAMMIADSVRQEVAHD